MCMSVHGFVPFLIDLPFFHISLCLCSSSFTFSFEHFIFSQITRVLSIVSPIVPPFQKICENCHVANVTFFNNWCLL